MAARKRLGERLLERGVITESQLADAIRAQQVTGEELGSGLMRLGYVDEDDLMRLLCEDADIPFVEGDEVRAQPSAVAAIPQALARAHGVLPLSEENGRIRVALGNPFDIAAVTALERVTGRPLTVVAAPRGEITRLIDQAYRRGDTTAPGAGPASDGPDTVPGGPVARASGEYATVGQARGNSEVVGSRQGGQGVVPAAPVEAEPVEPRRVEPRRVEARPTGREVGVRRIPAATGGDGGFGGRVRAAEARMAGSEGGRIVDEVIRRAVVLGATDIHLEPRESELGIRYRVDGALQAGGAYPKAAEAGILLRLKGLAGIPVEGAVLPQEGRFRVPVEGRQVQLRLSTYPTLHGEDAVVRVLDRSRARLDLAGLGMAPADLSLLRESLRRPHGLIVVTGPSGSGRTTTLHSALRQLDTVRQSVLTLEDPIEYELEGVRQAEVDVEAGLTFAAGLRSMLRHDPDVVMVGDLRDPETMELALSAALTGVLVLSTLHADSAADAVQRLLEMGAEPYVLASSLQLVVAQRLVRVLCQQCKSPVEVPDEVRKRYGVGDAEVLRARGCSACRRTGYRGRIALFETLPTSAEVEQAVHGDAPADDIRRLVRRPTLLQDGVRKVIAGVTSLEEVLKVTGV